MTHEDVLHALEQAADSDKRAFFPRFFKTGPGEYGEGDVFLGVTVPRARIIAKTFRALPMADIVALLQSPIHECRLTALLILVDQYKRGDQVTRSAIADMYLRHLDRINNWDLVDSSADKIIGAWVDESGDESVLERLASSGHLWSERVAIVATVHFIRKNEFNHTFRIAEMLLMHKHDLIHKAVGWMLREVGKRNLAAEKEFLNRRYHRMPRTMLRYAIEKFEESERQRYLRGEV